MPNLHGHPKVAASESTPLLTEVEPRPITPDDESCEHTAPDGTDEDDRPLPMGQMAVLCFTRLIEPIAFFGIIPFVQDMVERTGGIKEADVGFYSGLIESLFSLTQMTVMIGWGRAADRFGRKPVMVISLCGSAVGVSLFGFSRTIWQMILFRCVAGLFAGTIVTVRAMISENSTPKTQAKAFSYFAFTGNMGMLVGPLLGAALVDPAKQYPNVFGHIKLFKELPFALPTLVSGGFAAVGAVLAILFLKETLKKKDANVTAEPPMTMWQLLKSPGVPVVLLTYGYVMWLAITYTAVAPLFWFTSIELGGYGFTPQMISVFMSFGGAAQAAWLLLAFPYLQRRFGTVKVLKGCAIIWPIFFALPPVCNTLLRYNLRPAFWVLSILLQVFGSSVAMAFTSVQLMLNDNSPSPETLGTLNAIALTVLSAVRTICPGFFTSLFAIGVGHQILGGYLIWLVLVLLALPLLVIIRWVPKKAEGRPKRANNSV